MTDTPNLGVLRRLAVERAAEPAEPLAAAPDDDGAPLAVRFERAYPTSANNLWDALTTPERVDRWLGALTGDLRAGGDFLLDMAEPAGTDEDARNGGRILECEPRQRLLVTWEATGQATSQVEVITSTVGQQALLTLEHRDLPEPSARGYGAGWHDFLDRLENDLAGRQQADWTSEFERYLVVYRALPVA
jgi:uncharacterized protein YndB with AHSA1/START domain